MIYYFDGACGPTNPGGVVQYGWHRLSEEDRRGDEQGYGVAFSSGPTSTNNIAEYIALGALLVHILAKTSSVRNVDRKLVVRGDSQLVVNQFNGEWRVRKSNLRPIAAMVYIVRDQLIDKGWTITAEWVAGYENKQADKLSRRAMNEMMMDRRPLTDKQNGARDAS